MTSVITVDRANEIAEVGVIFVQTEYTARCIVSYRPGIELREERYFLRVVSSRTDMAATPIRLKAFSLDLPFFAANKIRNVYAKVLNAPPSEESTCSF